MFFPALSARRTVTLSVAIALVALAYSSQPVQAQDFRAEQQFPTFLESLQGQIQDDDSLSGIAVDSGEVVRWKWAAGKDLRFHVTGGTLAQRLRLSAIISEQLRNDREWREWLTANGSTVVFQDPTSDFEELIPVQLKRDDELSKHTSHLLEVVQDRIEVDDELGGALISRGLYHSRMGVSGHELVLQGRVLTEDQLPLLKSLLVESMAGDEYWRTARHNIVLSLNGVAVQPISEVFQKRYYVLGMDEFWEGDYFAADEAFKRALADRPGDLILSYWRVVTHLAMHQDERAEMKLRHLIRRNPWGQAQATIAREFGRVQGPLRGRLRTIEQHILLTMDP